MEKVNEYEKLLSEYRHELNEIRLLQIQVQIYSINCFKFYL